MATHLDLIRMHLASGPRSARQLSDSIGISQPTLSRALSSIGDELVRVGNGPSIQYALRDGRHGHENIPIYRVSEEGKLSLLGHLIPVLANGYVMRQDDGKTVHSDSLPWWITDMRPQGYLGRAFVAQHAGNLGLPNDLNAWSDAHALSALISNGHDAVGNLLIGDVARNHFLQMPQPEPIEISGSRFAQLAEAAARGELPGSSAGGEQPKFTTYVKTERGPQHVIVKFSANEDHTIAQRWRDLLLAEHLALETLREACVSDTRTQIIDHGLQRFLIVHRFDRVGTLGRRGLFSLSALDAEFVGMGAGGWHLVTERLAQERIITAESVRKATLYYAFGRLIGNTDMHLGNLSFMSAQGRPYELAPAYDMLPMGFAPKSGGGLTMSLPSIFLDAGISHDIWRDAISLVQNYLNALEHSADITAGFEPCVAAIKTHLNAAMRQIDRLA